MRQRKRGFTLLELIITTVLIAVLTAIAIPSYSASIARQRQRVEIDALFHALHLARKESIMRLVEDRKDIGATHAHFLSIQRVLDANSSMKQVRSCFLKTPLWHISP